MHTIQIKWNARGDREQYNNNNTFSIYLLIFTTSLNNKTVHSIKYIAQDVHSFLHFLPSLQTTLLSWVTVTPHLWWNGGSCRWHCYELVWITQRKMHYISVVILFLSWKIWIVSVCIRAKRGSAILQFTNNVHLPITCSYNNVWVHQTTLS